MCNNFTANRSSPRTSFTSSSAPSRTPPPGKGACRGKYRWRKSWTNGWINRECRPSWKSSRLVFSLPYSLGLWENPFKSIVLSFSKCNNDCGLWSWLVSAIVAFVEEWGRLLVIVMDRLFFASPDDYQREEWPNRIGEERSQEMANSERPKP